MPRPASWQGPVVHYILGLEQKDPKAKKAKEISLFLVRTVECQDVEPLLWAPRENKRSSNKLSNKGPHTTSACNPPHGEGSKESKDRFFQPEYYQFRLRISLLRTPILWKRSSLNVSVTADFGSSCNAGISTALVQLALLRGRRHGHSSLFDTSKKTP